MGCTFCHLTREVIAENAHWRLVVNENQATLGRVYFVLNRHETDVSALTSDEQSSLWEFAARAKRTLVELFAPDHFNYLFHMNLTPHIHLHIYPRYAAPREFAGQGFTDSNYGGHYDPDETLLIDDDAQSALVAALREHL